MQSITKLKSQQINPFEVSLCENREVCDGSKKLEGGELQEEENWAQNQYLVWKITNTERRKD